MTDLAAYIAHAERYGPECVLDTAATDLDKQDLGQLKAWLDSRHRSYTWQPGRAGGPDSRWVERRTKPRACEWCGLDLPAGATNRMRMHGHCTRQKADRAYQSRKRTNQSNSDAGGPDAARGRA